MNSKVIILHGWTYSIDKWNGFVELMKNSGINCSMPAIPGLTADLNSPWNMEDYVNWLKETLDKESEKVVLVGHSNGGRIAISFSAKYPEKLAHLVLIDSAGIYHNEAQVRFKRFIFGILAKFGKKIYPSEKFRNLLYKFARVIDYKDATPLMRETMANLISVDMKNDLSIIRVPTTIIWGAQDKYTPVSDGRLMNQLIEGSKLHILDSAKHSPQYTHPQEVCEIIKKAVA